MNDYEKEIAKMSNMDIRDNILSLNIEQLKYVKEASYLNLFNTIATLKNTLKYENQLNNLELASEINLLNNYVDRIMNLLISSIDLESDEKRKIQLEKLMDMRQELYDLSSVLDGYSIELSYVGELVDQYGIKILTKRDYENSKYNIKRIDELVDIVNHTLNQAKDDYSKYIYIISQLILILPMRLVKDNYFNIVKNTIIRNFKSSTKAQIESQINEYKKQFDSSIRDGYGTKFDYYFREIQKLRNINLSDKNLEELDDVVNNIVRLTGEISGLFDFIIRLGLVCNMMIVIYLTDKVSISSKVEEIYETWIGINEDEESIEKLRKTIDNEIKNIEQAIFTDLEKFQILNSEALKREDFNYDELSEELLYTRRVLTYYNDANFSEHSIMFSEDNNLVKYDYLEQISDTLIQYINRSLIKMNNIERKVRMRKLLSEIELPFSGIEEFNNYIRYSLDSKVLSEEEINFTIDYMIYFLEGVENLG